MKKVKLPGWLVITLFFLAIVAVGSAIFLGVNAIGGYVDLGPLGGGAPLV